MKKSTSLRLSKVAHDLLSKLSDIMGVSKTAVIELAIRDLAKRKGVKCEK